MSAHAAAAPFEEPQSRLPGVAPLRRWKRVACLLVLATICEKSSQSCLPPVPGIRYYRGASFITLCDRAVVHGLRKKKTVFVHVDMAPPCVLCLSLAGAQE